MLPKQEYSALPISADAADQDKQADMLRSSAAAVGQSSSAADDDEELNPPACRICLDSAVSSDNPLISPCRCTGSTGYVHRECLKRWREMKHGTAAHYRCEICHFTYQFRRLWYAAVLRHPLTSFLIFATLLSTFAFVAGFIPLLEALGVPRHPITHMLNGLVILGLIGFIFLMGSICAGGSSSALADCGSCGGCYLGDCGACAAGGGEACAAMMLFVLVAAAVAGMVYVSTIMFGAFYHYVRSQVSMVETMVENVGGSPGGRAAKARKTSAAGAAAEAGGSGGGSGGGGSGSGGPSSSSEAAPLMRAPDKESMV
ncbi:hypothetical protein HYH03_017748 [Edaphochlamys debaryana]|uniref:RING-CH-type domain-containing protein n=1 Tax=Edaphochlamys debaryana TaxID=47281 RepID=A0A835XJG5_9CHLO|nr:hypothetical protein HYH03_017748 [Edaphochlamys debaryana]|eukprot:KAG2483396.1 hypothetical protein HYH03_017748 [Edaphochlamys debaryana]